LGSYRTYAISGSQHQVFNRQKCSCRVLTDDWHALLWALAGNICTFLLAYLVPTGYVALNRHLTVIKIPTDPVYPKCGEEEETAYHFLGKCNEVGSHLVEINELQHVQPHSLLRFPRAKKRFTGYFGAAHWAETTASVLDSFCCPPRR